MPDTLRVSGKLHAMQGWGIVLIRTSEISVAHAARSIQGRFWLRSLIPLATALVAIIAGLFAPLTSPVAAQWSAPRTVYIDETGQTLDQAFLDLWRAGGGADTYGYPISPEFTLDNGHIIQYLQYARFEWWPEGNAEGVHMFAANIGEELRPLNIPRTVPITLSTTTSAESARNREALAIQRAWLPVSSQLSAADLRERARFVADSQHTVRGAFREFWDRTGGPEFLGNPLTEQFQSEGSTYQIFERGQLVLNADKTASMVQIGKILADKYQISQTPQPQGDIPSYSEDLFVPPAPRGPGIYGYIQGGGAVWIDINLSTQYMVIYQGNTVIGETYISSGRSGFETPTGTFYVQTKYELDDMEGTLGGEYYYLPDVPDVMYFTDRGHAIHGAYWHNNFGTPMSHGCINVPLSFASWLFDITPYGAQIVIHY